MFAHAEAQEVFDALERVGRRHDERQRRAQQLRRAYFARLALASVKARKARRQAKGGEASR